MDQSQKLQDELREILNKRDKISKEEYEKLCSDFLIKKRKIDDAILAKFKQDCLSIIPKNFS